MYHILPITNNNQKVFKRVIDVAMYIAESITIVVFIYIYSLLFIKGWPILHTVV